jgi:hypothetical protein
VAVGGVGEAGVLSGELAPADVSELEAAVWVAVVDVASELCLVTTEVVASLETTGSIALGLDAVSFAVTLSSFTGRIGI